MWLLAHLNCPHLRWRLRGFQCLGALIQRIYFLLSVDGHVRTELVSGVFQAIFCSAGRDGHLPLVPLVVQLVEVRTAIIIGQLILDGVTLLLERLSVVRLVNDWVHAPHTPLLMLLELAL